MDNNLIELVAETLLEVLQEKNMKPQMVPVGISARHLHLTQEHIMVLFGQGHSLTPIKALSQPGQFACEETVEVVGPKGSIAKVRVLGPARKETQVEVSMSDARKLGLAPPVSGSGELKGSPGVLLRTKNGEVSIPQGVIVADRHLHMTPEQSEMYGFENGTVVQAHIEGPKGGIMGNIRVRVNPSYELDLHVDTDDASAFLLKQGQLVYVEKNSL